MQPPLIRQIYYRHPRALTLIIPAILAIMAALALGSCADIRGPAGEPVSQAKKQARETYRHIRDTLKNSGDTLDYDTLMDVYGSIVQSQYEIPHIDQLLNALILKRNENPRIDQMILIFSAKAIRKSKFPIPDVYEIFESILKMDDSRINEWVISFVAGAVGAYAFEIPDGDRLADLLEERLDQIQSASRGTRECFGFHFLPPPRSDLIRAYISGIEEQRKREVERRSYYSLTLNNITEIQIEAALERILAHGTPETKDKHLFPMKYMLLNMDKVFSAPARESMPKSQKKSNEAAMESQE